MRKICLWSIPLLLVIATSCKKEPVKPEEQIVTTDTTYVTEAIYVLNEGIFNMNNTTLTYYDFTELVPKTDYFDLQNGRKLGDTGNDLGIYGTKLYVVVNVSSQLEVISALTGKSIKRIPFFNGTKPRQPRYITFYANKAFVCSFDGTVAVIDTSSLEIEKYITVGRNPDGIAVANNKIYVSNSGGLDSPNYDSTISVINIASFTEIKKIPVAINPYNIVPDQYGDLYVISRGNYGDVKMSLQVIDSKTDKLKYTFPNLEAINLAINGDSAYVYYYDFNTGTGSKIMLIDVRNKTIIRDNFITDGTVIETVYGIAVNKRSGDVFITDAHGFVNTGDIVCFSKDGKKKYSFKAGLNPSHIIFLNSTKIDTLKSKI